jgi:hypothetical protein
MRSIAYIIMLGGLTCACGAAEDSDADTKDQASKEETHKDGTDEADADESSGSADAEDDSDADGDEDASEVVEGDSVDSTSGQTVPGEDSDSDDDEPGVVESSDEEDDAADEGESSDGDLVAAAPALCSGDDECPEGVECVQVEGEDFGYCDIDDAVVVPDGSNASGPDDGTTQAVPAACETDEDCGGDIACVKAEGDDFGYCDVADTSFESGSTEEGVSGVTQAVPAVCETDEDCGGDIACVKAEGDDFGYCDVAETEVTSDGSDTETTPDEGVSLAVPAVCETDEDCGGDIACVKAEGDDFGYCDVAEVELTSDGSSEASSGGISMATPAICEADADCGENVECIKADGDAFGYCNVEEAISE